MSQTEDKVWRGESVKGTCLDWGSFSEWEELIVRALAAYWNEGELVWVRIQRKCWRVCMDGEVAWTVHEQDEKFGGLSE